MEKRAYLMEMLIESHKKNLSIVFTYTLTDSGKTCFIDDYGSGLCREPRDFIGREYTDSMRLDLRKDLQYLKTAGLKID